MVKQMLTRIKDELKAIWKRISYKHSNGKAGSGAALNVLWKGMSTK